MFLDLCIVLVELVFRLVYCFSKVTLRECYSEEVVRIVKGVLL